MHKILNRNAPIPLQTLFNKNENRNNHNELSVCSQPKIELFKKSLQYSGAVLWNSLPDQLTEANQLNCFTKHYKRLLFYLHDHGAVEAGIQRVFGSMAHMSCLKGSTTTDPRFFLIILRKKKSIHPPQLLDHPSPSRL